MLLCRCTFHPSRIQWTCSGLVDNWFKPLVRPAQTNGPRCIPRC
jgi:hypothetical protein